MKWNNAFLLVWPVPDVFIERTAIGYGQGYEQCEGVESMALALRTCSHVCPNTLLFHVLASALLFTVCSSDLTNNFVLYVWAIPHAFPSVGAARESELDGISWDLCASMFTTLRDPGASMHVH